MKLWHIRQSSARGYDTYSDAVVAAPDEAAARRTHPGGDCTANERGEFRRGPK